MMTIFFRVLGSPAQNVETVGRRSMENRMVESSRNDTGFKKVVLDDNHVRRMEKFDGDQKTFRSWKFSLEAAIGQ
eukprot:10570712-Karenia_brevis.AAC.1